MKKPITQIRLDRLENGKLSLSWRSGTALGRAELYWSPFPVDIESQGLKLMEVQGVDESIVFDDPNPGRRTYLKLKFEQGFARIVAERKLPLQGMANFRDLGGYETVNGRFIKWGMLFRSEQLSGLAEPDFTYLQNCGLKLICDYRADHEIMLFPNPETVTARRVRIPIATTDSLQPEDKLIVANRNYVLNHAAEFSKMFELLQTAEGLPALQHCVAGKDRTGFGCAVLLLALGVPEQTVMEDYLLTNQFKEGLAHKLLGSIQPELESIHGEGRLPSLLETRPEYLQAAFDEIHGKYGSMDRYLEDALGLTAAKRKLLQDLLLSDE